MLLVITEYFVRQLDDACIQDALNFFEDENFHGRSVIIIKSNIEDIKKLENPIDLYRLS